MESFLAIEKYRPKYNIQVVLGIIVLYFLLNLLAISFFLDKILLSYFRVRMW